ncbi:hypothetical protein M2244_002909 [Rhodoferax antarcticus]|nr:hypothetical protein RA876_09980 [Rhodoferax antarcticus]MCW2313159.1 hypothetical protein [Rhodoferax antarcticus]
MMPEVAVAALALEVPSRALRAEVKLSKAQKPASAQIPSPMASVGKIGWALKSWGVGWRVCSGFVSQGWIQAIASERAAMGDYGCLLALWASSLQQP